jgi:hypothetical protein
MIDNAIFSTTSFLGTNLNSFLVSFFSDLDLINLISLLFLTFALNLGLTSSYSNAVMGTEESPWMDPDLLSAPLS